MKTLILAVALIGLNFLLLTSNLELRTQNPPTTAPLIQAADLVYAGAFRFPPSAGGTKTFAYGGSVIALTPRGTLLGLTQADQLVAEFTVPTLKASTTVAGLARAVLVQPYTDVLAGHRNDGGPRLIGGLLPLSDRLIVSAFVYYDASFPAETKSHFRTGLDFKNLGTVTGPVQIAADARGGFVGGEMTPIPPEWQAALGGPALTGQCCIPIISRTSYGPSVTVFDPFALGTGGAVRLLGYPSNHATLGLCAGGAPLFNCATEVGGVVFPGGTRSVLFFGKLATTFCYGHGTSNQALDGTTDGQGVTYCYNPTSSRKGNHGYPYQQFVWAYDANELAAVKAGTKNPWDVLPYSTWALKMPFENDLRNIQAAAFDPVTRRIFISVEAQDGALPLIHVFTLGASTLPPPVPIDCVVSPWSPWSPWVSSAVDQTRIRTRTIVTLESNGGQACPALTDAEYLPLVPVPVSAVTMRPACTLEVSDVPPDALGGWTIQFYRNGSPFGAAVTTAPYTQLAIVVAGPAIITAAWTKLGYLPVTRVPWPAPVAC